MLDRWEMTPAAEWRQWCALVAADGQRLGWTTDTKLTLYFESVADCGFRALPLRDLHTWEFPGEPFEGRIFGEHAEVRWIYRDQHFEAWSLRELSVSTDEAAVCRTDQRYFLIGTRDATGTFSDARYPRAFTYPLPPVPPTGKTRPFITVAEYSRPKPAWSDDWSEEKVTEQLDAPIVCAHRFVALGEV